MINRYLSLFLFCFLGFSAFSQNAFDAYRYSNWQVGGTARTVGVGGALGAFGADFATLSVNPAGLAWYRRSEFTFTPAITATRSSSVLFNDPNNAASEETRSVFNINNIGVVIASRPRSADWTTFNFGFGLNRQADFNKRFFFAGTSSGTITDRFLELANSPEGPDDFEGGLAVDAEAIYLPSNGNEYVSDFGLAPEDAEVYREQDVVNRGAINEMVFSFGGNYKERIMFGATVGVPFVNFSEDKTYVERDDEGDVIPIFEDLEYIEELTTTGIGINLKLGLIARPHQMVRVGLAVHTPTAFRLEDSYRTEMTYNYTDQGVPYRGDAQSPDGLFEYRLRTPWRFIGSAGFIFGKNGFLSAEVEHLNFTNNTFRFDGFREDERAVNEDIDAQFKPVTNFKVGGELAYEIFRFRAGFNVLPSALEGDDTVNYGYSVGLGFRERNFFLDVAYRRDKVKETYVPYQTSTGIEQFVDNDVVYNRFLATFGFRF